MLSVFILVVSTIALVYLLMQLVRAKKQGRFLQTIRDLFIILLAILMTAAIFYIGFRFFRAFLKMSETLFEKIINREIPADIIYEDDLSM